MTGGTYPVLTAVRQHAGTVLDDGCGGVFGRAAKRLADARRIFLADNLVNLAAAPLSLTPPSAATWCEWRGGVGGPMLSAVLGTSAAALIEPINDGAFAGGCSLEFWASNGDALLPAPGRIVVTSHYRAGLSPMDQIRAAGQTLTAEEASAAELTLMDRAGCRFAAPSGQIILRCMPDDDTIAIAGPELGDARTWAGPDLRTALANTAVVVDFGAGLLSAHRPQAVQTAAAPFASLLIEYGPRAALLILSALAIRRHAN